MGPRKRGDEGEEKYVEGKVRGENLSTTKNEGR